VKAAGVRGSRRYLLGPLWETWKAATSYWLTE
jgi:hypothetical protein